MSKKIMDKRSYADVLFGHNILFGAAYVHCFRFLLGQLTPIKKNTNKKLKLVGKAGSASRLDSGLLKRSEIGVVNKKNGHLGMAQSGNNWLDMAR